MKEDQQQPSTDTSTPPLFLNDELRERPIVQLRRRRISRLLLRPLPPVSDLDEIDGLPTMIHLPCVRPQNIGHLETRNPIWQFETTEFTYLRDSSLDELAAHHMIAQTDPVSDSEGDSPVVQSEITAAAGNAAVIGIGTIAGSVLKYGGNLIIQRGFGAGIYGIYSLSLSLVSLLAAILNLGLDDAMVRYIAIYRSKQQGSFVRGLTVFCTALAGLIGLVGGVLILLFAPAIANFRHDPSIAVVLQLMAPLVPLTTMQVIWFGGLQGFKAFKWRVLTDRIVFPIVWAVLLGGVLLFHGGLTEIVLVLIISDLVVMVASLRPFLGLLARMSSQERGQYALGEWLGFAVPNFLTSIVDMALESTDTLLLAFFAVSYVGIGQYNAAIKISSFIAMPLFALNTMFAPTIAELHSRGEQQKLATMFQVVTKWTITLSLPIFLVASLFSRSLLNISGGGFVDAWPVLVVLSLGSIVNTGTGAVGYMLLMTGHQRLSFLNSLTAVVANVILGVILTPKYGAMGTAIATGMAIGIVNLMRLLQVHLLLHIHPYRWDTLKPVGAGLISATLVGVLLYLLGPSPKMLWFQLALIPVFLASYVGLILLFRIDAEDQIVVNALRKKLRLGTKKN